MKSAFSFVWTLAFAGLLLSCSETPVENSADSASAPTDTANQAIEKQQIGAMLDSFNVAAARADFEGYFDHFTDDAIFMGTDATERWDKEQFKVWAKPAFDSKRTWDFTSLDRHIYFDKSGKTAWFDELLNTSMKICRGSGVVVRQGEDWKVQQYVLSMTLPNSQINAALKLKAPEEDKMIDRLKQM